VAERLRKLRADSGAASASTSISITPASVSSITHCFDISAGVAFSKGSAGGSSAARRAFFFAGASAGAPVCRAPADK
jgi:hypothetical protein